VRSLTIWSLYEIWTGANGASNHLPFEDFAVYRLGHTVDAAEEDDQLLKHHAMAIADRRR
jgi:hypothetical protein